MRSYLQTSKFGHCISESNLTQLDNNYDGTISTKASGKAHISLALLLRLRYGWHMFLISIALWSTLQLLWGAMTIINFVVKVWKALMRGLKSLVDTDAVS